MTSRERIKAIFEKKPVDRFGFWLGNPADDAKDIYYKYFGIEDKQVHKKVDGDLLYTTKSGHADLELNLKLKSDFMWLSPELDPASSWKHPERTPMWDVTGGKKKESLNDPGIFGNCEDVKKIEKFNWPDPKYLDFKSTIENIDEARAAGLAVLGGMWCPFFHVMADFFGMENYFFKMYSNPEVIEAATERIIDFYLAANKRVIEEMGDKIDAFFFGNDFGSQCDLMISPEMFDKFIKPYFKKIINQLKFYNKKVVLHSCGSIIRIIPELIELGIDGLHPLQAKAKGMDAENLVKEFGNSIVFIGGVDTQELLPFKTPKEVREEVLRLKKIFKQGFIISPSHEAILPHVKIENVIAMSEAATEN
jgi:uroporphyrinogen decarboxylase